MWRARRANPLERRAARGKKIMAENRQERPPWPRRKWRVWARLPTLEVSVAPAAAPQVNHKRRAHPAGRAPLGNPHLGPPENVPVRGDGGWGRVPVRGGWGVGVAERGVDREVYRDRRGGGRE
jgi:hypothetical protein